jgi:diacylglycerol kinase (ATP)
MPVRKMIDSFNYALDGIIYALRTQRNMRIHLLITILLILLGINFVLSRTEIMALTFCVTAIESAIDLFTRAYHEQAKIAKNVAAGAVLISAINATLIGYLVFIDKLMAHSKQTVQSIRTITTHQIFIVLVLVMIAVIFVKFRTGTDNYFRGGFPSGHVALAFSMLTFITMESGSLIVVLMAAMIALLVAQSRYETRIHNLFQIIAGALLGSLVTLLAYKILFLR